MGSQWKTRHEDDVLTDALIWQVASDEYLASQLSNFANTLLKGASPEVQSIIVSVIHLHRVKAMEGRARIGALDARYGHLSTGEGDPRQG
jgi:hypothetical protein